MIHLSQLTVEVYQGDQLFTTALKCLFHYTKTNQTLFEKEIHGQIDLVRIVAPQNNNVLISQNIYFVVEQEALRSIQTTTCTTISETT